MNNFIKIELYFSGLEASRITLAKTIFFHPLISKPLISSRGKIPAHFATGSFEWTSGVKGVVQLLLKSFLGDDQGIVGGKDSLAASFDLALSKKPLWLLEMFGVDSKGSSLANHLFRRENPERKREGDVRVFVNKIVQIKIFKEQNELRLSNKDEIYKIYNSIEKPVQKSKSLDEILFEALFSTSFKSLKDTSIIYDRSISSRYLKNQTLNKFATGEKSSVLFFLSRMKNQSRLNTVQSSYDVNYLRGALHKLGGLKIAIPAGLIESILIFKYMELELKLPIKIDWKYPYAVPLLRCLQNGFLTDEINCFALGLITALRLQKNSYTREFLPAMLLPKLEHTLINSGSNNFHLLCDEPTTSAAFLDEYITLNQLPKNKFKITHRDQDELSYEFANSGSSDTSFAFFGIYSELNLRLKGINVSIDKQPLSDQHSILYCSNEINTNSKLLAALKTCINESWITLGNNPEILKNIIQNSLENTNLGFYLKRYSGATFLTV